MTAARPQGACGYMARGLVAALVITIVSLAGASGPAVGVAVPGGRVSRSAEALASTSRAVDRVTMWCTTSSSYVNPSLLDLLAPQIQSGPVQTVTCVPATVGEDGSVTALAECTVSTTSTTPGLLDLLGPQVQSGPLQTMTCVPTAAAGGSDGGAVTVLPACAVTHTYTNPGLLGLLGPQFQSGPVQAVTCLPAAVVPGNSTGGAANNVILGTAADPSASSRSPGATATGDSALAATGPPLSPFAAHSVSVLLMGLGLLGLRIAGTTGRGARAKAKLGS